MSVKHYIHVIWARSRGLYFLTPSLPSPWWTKVQGMSTIQTFPQPDDASAVVATNIRMLLARDQKPQAQLAVVLGITQSQLSKRLRGVILFDLEELVKVADYFRVSVGNLFGESTNRHPDGGPDGGIDLRARRDSNSQPSDPKVLPLRRVA